MVCTYCGAHRNESDTTCSVCGADFTQLNKTENSQSTNTSVDGFNFDDIFGNVEKNTRPKNADNFLNLDEIATLGDVVNNEEITTFDDLFGEDKTKGDSEEITTFDDLFGEDKAKGDGENITTFDDLFGEDKAKGDSQEVTTFEELFGQDNVKDNSEEVTTFEELFGQVENVKEQQEEQEEQQDKAFDMSLDELDNIEEMLLSKTEHADVEEQSQKEQDKAFDMSLDELDDIQDMLLSKTEHSDVEQEQQDKVFDMSLDELDNIEEMLLSKTEHADVEEEPQDQTFDMSLDELDDIQDMLLSKTEHADVEEESQEEQDQTFDMSLDELDDIQDMLLSKTEHADVEEEPQDQTFDMSLDELDDIEEMLLSKTEHADVEEEPKEEQDKAFDMSLDELDDIEEMLLSKTEHADVEEESKEEQDKAFDMSLDELDNIEEMLLSKTEHADVEEESKEEQDKAFDMSLDELDNIEEMLLSKTEHADVEEEPQEEQDKAFDMSLDELDNIEEMLLSKTEHADVEEEPQEEQDKAFDMSLDELDDIQDMLLSKTEHADVEEEPKEEQDKAFDMSLDELDDIQDMLISKTENLSDTIIDDSNIVEPKFEDVEYIDDDFFDIDETDIEIIDSESRGVKKSNKKKKEVTFDFSLDDLDDIEKSLINDEDNTEETLSYLEQALISGEDISDFDVKEALNVDDDEDGVTVEFFDEKEIEEIATIRKVKSFDGFNVPFDLFEKVRDGLVLKRKGEPIPFATISSDSRSDDEILKEVQATVTMLMNDQIADDNINDELLELEQMLLSRNEEVKEKSDYVFEEVEDTDLEELEGFVDAEDIDDEDNVLKLSEDDKIQDEIDNIVKNFKENAKDGIITESTSSILDIIDKDTDTDAEPNEVEEELESDTEVDELDLIEKQILVDKDSLDKSQGEDDDDVLDTTVENLDSLISAVVGEVAKSEEENFEEKQEEKSESIYKIKTLELKRYDEDLVREYEALRLDLELFFPGTQDLDNLSRDIDALLSIDELEELTSTGINFDGMNLDVEELTDKDITDALLEMRDLKQEEDAKRLERIKKRKLRREKEMYYLTLGNRVKVYDTVMLLALIFTALFVINAWFAVERNKNIAVSVQSRSEQVTNAEELWNGIYELATGFIELQDDVAEYNKGELSGDKVSFELIAYVDKSVEVRGKFENVGLPTYSEYKYKIDEFLAARMLLAEEVLEDVEQGNTNSSSINDLLNVKTDMDQFDSYKDDFFKKLNLN